MVFEEREELYLALPKKELQKLCKSHGLSCSNATKGRLAKLLVDHLNTRRNEESPEANPGARRKRGRPRLQGVLGGEDGTDTGAGVGDPQMAWEFGSHGVCEEKQDHMQDAGDVGGAGFSHRCPHGKEALDCSGNCLAAENVLKDVASGSGLASSTEVLADAPASFQFFVRAEEGIRLYVDLNSSPSNWVKSLNDEVIINQKVQRGRAWSLSNELRDVVTKDAGVSSSGEILDASKNVDALVTKESDDGKESSKSSLTSIFQDKGAETMEIVDERNQPSSSYVVSSSEKYPSHLADLSFPILALPSVRSIGKGFVPSNKSLSSEDCLNQICCDPTHKENIDNLPEEIPGNTESLNCQNTESGYADKSPISMSETSDLAPNPKMCDDGEIQNSEDIQMHGENDSSSMSPQDAEVQEENLHTDHHNPALLISESHEDMAPSGAGSSMDDLSQVQVSGSLASPVSENLALIPSKEQCIPCVKEKLTSGKKQSNNLTSKVCTRSSAPGISAHKRSRASLETSQVAMINLRSRKTLAREPVSGSATFPRRSKRLVAK